jgi:hypothetical protein
MISNKKSAKKPRYQDKIMFNKGSAGIFRTLKNFCVRFIYILGDLPLSGLLQRKTIKLFHCFLLVFLNFNVKVLNNHILEEV